MSTTPSDLIEPAQPEPMEESRVSGALAWSSFIFAALQSVCSAVIAIDGFRIAIGVGALILTSGAGAAMVRFHTDRIRIPMIVLAIIGSVVNLAILIHVRRLRNRPAAQWRRAQRTSHQVRMERLQWILSSAALVLVAIEEYFHFSQHHRF